MNRYNFKTIESKWQEKWFKEKIFKSKIDKSKKKFYCLTMFILFPCVLFLVRLLYCVFVFLFMFYLLLSFLFYSLGSLCGAIIAGVFIKNIPDPKITFASVGFCLI